MDNRYISLEWRPELERPVLIAAFTGWNDAAEAASVALAALRDSWEARNFGVFDAEEFFDYQAARPRIKLVEGVTRTIEWPENQLAATAPSLGVRRRARSRIALRAGAELPVALVLRGGDRSGQGAQR